MTADQRAGLAREYLTGARKRKVDQLPPSLLMRECAELRRLLGQCLDVIEHQPFPLTDMQRAIVLDALEYGAASRREAAAWCTECRQHPASLCPAHETSLETADAYRQAAREIGGAR